MTTRTRRLLRLTGEILLILIILLAVERFMTRDALRGPAPPLEAITPEGRALSLEALRGQPVLVYFWATWCPVCDLSQGTMDRLGQDHAMVTVAMRSGDPASVSRHLARAGLNWTVAADEAGDISRAWGVTGVPAVFVLDAQGQVRFVTRGYSSGPGLRLRLWWAGLAG